MTTLTDLLDEFRALSHDERTKGTMFERFIANVLVTDPLYADKLDQVWLWGEWPHRWGGDDGIDLVARERDTGDYWAIQCKFLDPAHTLQKGDIDSFFTASGKQFPALEGERSFANRLIVSTTDKWSKMAEEALKNQSVPVSRLFFRELAEAPIDWSQFSLSRPQDIRLKTKKTPREHQKEAITAVLNGFQTHDRGKLIMACGTGKTFTSLRLAEHITPDDGHILFLAPSISLVAQTLREWTAQAEHPIHAFVVCSDTKVGKDEEDIRTHDLAYPATTDARKLATAIQMLSHGRRTVVFSTYQSIQVVAEAQRQGLAAFDLIICDEAHRTTGLTLEGEDASDFVKVHQNHIVRGTKRLYMTATPRIYGDASKTKADNNNAVLFSMDDTDTFGPEFYRLGFGKAVERQLLAEYKVLIVAVEEERMATLANAYNAFKIGDKKAIDIAFAAKIIGSWKGLSKLGLKQIDELGEQEELREDTRPMRRAVAFSRSIKDSKQITEIFSDLVGLYTQNHDGEEDTGMVRCTLDHVDGGMNALQRQVALDWLKDNPGEGNCRILSNARCLSEGIDVPALDAVVFFDTRESIVDIVQSVGRVMRKADDKKFGYIILPVGIPSAKVKDYNSYIESDAQFKGIWKVIKALRAHDERLVDEAEFRRKVKVITGGGGGEGGGEGGGQLDIDFPMIPIDAINEAVYAAIPKKLGDREYWSEWAKSVGHVAEKLITRIRSLIDSDASMENEFAIFLKGLQDTLNPAVNKDEAIDMLAQHILTLPVFQALFAETDFPEHNAVGRDLQRIVNKLDAAFIASETEGLEKFYANVRERISLAKSDKSKQDIIRNLYDTFFNNAFPRMAERLGIVYTPVEVVDFILRSVQDALKKHFGTNLSERGVQVLDPFSGTGTFMVRLIQSGLIDAEALPYKFEHELHANEIVLLAYYIATVNLETAFHGQTGAYKPFPGMVLTDTFQMTEEGDMIDKIVLPENSDKAIHQLAQPIRVIIGNPPYSVGQDNANDNNQNQQYPSLNQRIATTYAAQSTATNKNSLYASEIKALRWASDRIGKEGMVAFVTNGSFIDGNTADGLRKSLMQEFSHLYVFNLRGNARTQGEQRRMEAGNIFDAGSRNTVAILLLVKDPAHRGSCELRYHDIGDYLDREEKLATLAEFGSIDAIPWQKLTPNDAGDWINLRNPEFEGFVALDDDPKAIFSTRSRGVETSRDDWVYNFSRSTLETNMRRMIDFYNNQVAAFGAQCRAAGKEGEKKAQGLIDTDPKKIKWTRGLIGHLARAKKSVFDGDKIGIGLYRPFSKAWIYYDRQFNEYFKEKLFPSTRHPNLAISVTGAGVNKDFTALIVDAIPDVQLLANGQCFPLYWYEKAKEQPEHGGLFTTGEQVDAEGYVRHDGITDAALTEYQAAYDDAGITKEDLFYHVYGVLHAPDYREKFAADLRKMLPRIPRPATTEDFWVFSRAGRKLADLHLNYEIVEPWPLEEIQTSTVPDYRVTKMRFPSKADKSAIIYNGHLTLKGIPPEALEYVVNGKSALEWVMERYQVRTDKEVSGIRNDPNEWSDDPRYIVDLVKRVVRVSVESVKVIKTLNIDVFP